MKSRLLILFIGLGQFLALGAQEADSVQYVSYGTFEMMSVFNPWLNSTNPAGHRFNTLAPGKINLKYHREEGDYKRVQQGNQLDQYSFQTERYKQIKRTFFYGNFSYDKGLEQGCNFNLVNDPFHGTPYLLIDTLGRDDIYDREFFKLRGDISTPFLKILNWGLSADMDVGLASQDRDPRPRNKVINLDISQGLLYATDNVSLGVNGLFSYFNEDVEVEIIEDNIHHVFLQLLGFDVYYSHEAGSYARLFKRLTYGGEGQLNFTSGRLNSLFGAKFLYLRETADDGRKASNASWSYIKNVSELEGNQIEFYNATTFRQANMIHSFNGRYMLKYMVGAEDIQRLEQVGEAGAVDWVHYMLEEKYGSTVYDIDLSYAFLLMKDQYRRNLEISIGMDLCGSEKAYYLPDQQENYYSRIHYAAIKKSFYSGRHEFALGANVKLKKTPTYFRDFNANSFIGEKILLPDFYYLTSKYTAVGLDAQYAVSLNKIFDRFFIHSNVNLYRGSGSFILVSEDMNRTIFNISTGVIF